MSAVAGIPPDDAVAAIPPGQSAQRLNRLESPILPPDLSDEQVVGRWLAAKATGRGRLAATTLAQYRIEAERLFWYTGKVGVPISNWTLDEFSAYVGFLQAPAPWAVRARGVRRGSPDWRPFLGPLTDRSAGQTQKIVTSLFDWLRDVGYLQLNPAAGLPTVGRREPEKQARDLFLVDLFERTGVRTTEAVRCAMGHVRIEPVPDALRRQFPAPRRSSGCCASNAARAARPAGCRATRLRCPCRPTGSPLACRRSPRQMTRCRWCCRSGVPGGANGRASGAARRSGIS